MSHKRSEIRAALKTLLVNGSTAAQTRVYTNRIHNKKELPAIVIHDELEDVVPRDIRSSQYIRTLTLNLELTIEATEDYDEVLDDLCKEVEDLISESNTISGTAISSVFTNTEFRFDAGEKPIGQAILTYQIKYIA